MSLQVASKSPDAFVVSMALDFCWTPMGSSMVLVGYMIFARLDHAIGTSRKYLVNDRETFTMASRIPTVEGDEAGTGGGVISGVNCGWCRPVEHSATFMVGDDWLVREGDLVGMNCAGPDGVPNTYGRVVIQTDVASSRESLRKACATSTDPETGALLVEEREVLRDGRTGAVVEVAQRSVIDPATGVVTTQRLVITTQPDGRRSYEAEAGTLDPVSKSYAWQRTQGALPEALEGEESGLEALDLRDVGEDGRLRYLAPSEEGASELPWQSAGAEIGEDDPELLAEPELKKALEEQASAEAEKAAIERAQLWEATKAGVDVAGIFDPTPASDVVGAGMALSDGDFIGFGLSLVAIAPYLGDVVAKPLKGTRAAAKLAKLVEKMAEVQGKLGKLTEKVRQAIAKGKEVIRRRRARKAGTSANAPAPSRAPPKEPGDGGFTPRKTEEAKKRPTEEEYEAFKRKKAEERLEKKRAEIAEERRALEANGRLYKDKKLTEADKEWLRADERRRELAYDQGRKQFRVDEARAALKAEEEGLLGSPMKRAFNDEGREIGGDIIDGHGKVWDAKDAVGIKEIQEALGSGENVLVHGTQSTIDAARAALGVAGNSEKLIFVLIGP